MALRPFDLADIELPHAQLAALPASAELDARLRARADRGTTPTCAAAVLAERGDRSIASLLTGSAAYLDPPELAGLAALSESDALACVVATPWLPAINRTAAAQKLTALPATPAALCVLGEIAERGSDAFAREAKRAAGEMSVRSDRGVREAADKLRARAALISQWTGIRRQELLREVATGQFAPAAALLAGDASFLAALIPPIADAARGPLVPALLANARTPDESQRVKTFALFHPRWRDLAREPLSVIARLSAMRGRDANIPTHAVDALARMGAMRELVIAVVSGANEARASALGALERAGARALTDVDRELVDAAIERLEHRGDAKGAGRLVELFTST
jgi:hypothetical protein